MAVPSSAVPKLSGTILRFGNGQKNRRVADRVDHNEIDDKGGDEALEHVPVISRWPVVRPPP